MLYWFTRPKWRSNGVQVGLEWTKNLQMQRREEDQTERSSAYGEDAAGGEAREEGAHLVHARRRARLALLALRELDRSRVRLQAVQALDRSLRSQREAEALWARGESLGPSTRADQRRKHKLTQIRSYILLSKSLPHMLEVQKERN